MTWECHGNLGGAETSARRLVARRAVCVGSDPPRLLAQPWLIPGSRLGPSQTRAERDLLAMIVRRHPWACGNVSTRRAQRRVLPTCNRALPHDEALWRLGNPVHLARGSSRQLMKACHCPSGESRSGNTRKLLAEGCGSARHALPRRLQRPATTRRRRSSLRRRVLSPSPVRRLSADAFNGVG
jgi:hypothetical protein